MTKTELKTALDLAGVTYAKKANLETLQAAYDALPVPAAPEELTPDLPAVVEQPTPEVAQVEAPATDATPATESNGLRIEKDRPEANGVKRPSIGGKCRAIWDALDDYRAETGELPTSKTVKELAADSGWNPNNASIEYYQWRKYNGIKKG